MAELSFKFYYRILLLFNKASTLEIWIKFNAP